MPGLWRTAVRLLGNARWAGVEYQCTVPLILVLAQGGLSTNRKRFGPFDSESKSCRIFDQRQISIDFHKACNVRPLRLQEHAPRAPSVGPSWRAETSPTVRLADDTWVSPQKNAK